MKVKNFNDYLRTRLKDSEIVEIKTQAEQEFQALKVLKNGVDQVVNEKENDFKIYETKQHIKIF